MKIKKIKEKVRLVQADGFLEKITEMLVLYIQIFGLDLQLIWQIAII